MRAPYLSLLAPLALLSLSACSGGSGSVVIDDTGGGGAGTDDTGLDDGGDDGGDEGGDDSGDDGGDDTGVEAPEPVFTFLLNGDGEDLAVDLSLTDFETGEILDRVA